ncbi:putative E3 ubiquitin-protein ligase [Sesbania bispinosa]|nr:putative E3 ubiquitin-protein ligase [Sesbania bispinosa]
MLVQKGGRRSSVNQGGGPVNSTSVKAILVSIDDNKGKGSHFSILGDSSQIQIEEVEPTINLVASDNVGILATDTGNRKLKKIVPSSLSNHEGRSKKRQELLSTGKKVKFHINHNSTAGPSRSNQRVSPAGADPNKDKIVPSLGCTNQAASGNKSHDSSEVNKRAKIKGIVGIHPKSRVSFKGTKEVAHMRELLLEPPFCYSHPL